MTARGLIQDVPTTPSAESGGATLTECVPALRPECRPRAGRRIWYDRDMRSGNK